MQSILTGDEVFSAGMDLAEIGAGTTTSRWTTLIALRRQRSGSLPIPVIAAIEGPCFGAAADLAIACDVRIQAETRASASPPSSLGILYRPEGIADMIATVGRETVSRLLLFGERISAEEAVAAGLAAHVVRGGRARRWHSR